MSPNERPLRHLSDDDVSTRGGALPEEGVPRETPDTQESLDSADSDYDEPDAGHRVEENEGRGRRNARPNEIDVDADNLVITENP